ncbi:hypothetical protein [Methylobacterium sp. 17Sr1-1]|uniref:hypothetical protein n=1 Tax=Methylobacterium sp. 17Sr1-1 TaxID=2202826 RepID=UPI000D6F5ED5|nr:hypothetical protein [Methylobacterium sp. 17Sr1-1]AWN55108.1 hypothetical protein DK412_28715 [Methylobacterium sp. 17Sr1-1]
MIDSLDIDPDDDVEIVLVVEGAFGITISEGEAEKCETVGDLFEVVRAHVPMVERSDDLPCLTARAFYALRRAILLRHPDRDLRPETYLTRFAGTRDHAGWHAHLVAETGLNIPSPSISGRVLGTGFAAFALAAAVTGKMLGDGGQVLAACLLEGAVIVALVRRYAPPSWEAASTLGDLARGAALQSIAQVVAGHGAIRRREAWGALVTVLRPYARRTGRIGPDTRFFAPGR